MGSADSVALTEEFDPHDPAISADDLYARYDRLRAVCPITRHSPHGGYWLATGYDEVRRAAMDSKTFSSANGVYLPAVAEHRLPVLEMDDPEHRVWRKVLAPRFSTVAARGWQPRIRELIDELIDGFIERGRADLIHDFAEPLPLALIAEVFGLEPEQRAQVREDALKFLDNSTGDAQAKALLESMVARWVRLVEQRRREPAEDLITAVVQADFSPHAVSDVDIAWLMFALTFGGHDSTLLALGSMLLHLAEHPEQRAELIADPKRIPAAVEELLRLHASLHNFRRDTVTDTELGGQHITAGDSVLLAWGAANRDPARFPDPNIAKFDRPNVRDHLTFGVGTHGCIGQFIARIELATAIELILERLGAYELDGIARRNGLTGGGHHHGVEYLPVRFTAGPRRGSSE
jgi:cytochrome P450